MIDRLYALPVTHPVQALGFSRGSVYYLPKPVRAADLAIMRRVDELHMNYLLPAAGYCVICSGPKGSRSVVCMSRP